MKSLTVHGESTGKSTFVVGKQLLEFSKEIQIYDTSIDR